MQVIAVLNQGRTRLPPFAEAVIEEVIRDFYLTPQRPTAQKAVIEVMRRCRERDIEPPSPGTIRARLNRMPERDRLRGRGYKEKAKNEFLPPEQKPAPGGLLDIGIDGFGDIA
jgi:putative transposase